MKKKLPVPEHMDIDGTVKEANRGRRRSALKRFDIRRELRPLVTPAAAGIEMLECEHLNCLNCTFSKPPTTQFTARAKIDCKSNNINWLR